MMQAGRYQNTFQKTVYRDTKWAGVFNRQSHRANTVLHIWPNLTHYDTEQDRDWQHNNGDKAVPGINRHHPRKLDNGVFVIHISSQRTGQNPGEYAHLQDLYPQHHRLPAHTHLDLRVTTGPESVTSRSWH